jgi:hypothetical protein|tara:strand:- start:454 stop:876 length:423 start_codon:yes stop_codon:yes gene_type:complete
MAFKMKGNPMARNYGIGSATKKLEDPSLAEPIFERTEVDAQAEDPPVETETGEKSLTERKDDVKESRKDRRATRREAKWSPEKTARKEKRVTKREEREVDKAKMASDRDARHAALEKRQDARRTLRDSGENPYDIKKPTE